MKITNGNNSIAYILFILFLAIIYSVSFIKHIICYLLEKFVFSFKCMVVTRLTLRVLAQLLNYTLNFNLMTLNLNIPNKKIVALVTTTAINQIIFIYLFI